jgi:integrase
MVQGKDKKWYIKVTKTAESTREVIVDDYVADLIRAMPEGNVYSGSPGQINEYLQATQKKLGIPKFRLHLMRHFFASTAREHMGDTYVEEAGGWKHGSQIMKKVYDYAQKSVADKVKRDFAKRMGEMLS